MTTLKKITQRRIKKIKSQKSKKGGRGDSINNVINYTNVNIENGKPVIETFVGGSDQEIQDKIKIIYDAASKELEEQWIGDQNNDKMVFLYIQNKSKSNIISIVRISNENKGMFPYELGHDYTLKPFRKKKLYELLFMERLKYINEHNPRQIYVSYTEFDHLKDLQIKHGMKLIGDHKVSLNGNKYWKLEFHSIDFKSMAIQMGYTDNNDNCNGIYIGNDNNNKGVIFTAGHCTVDDSITLKRGEYKPLLIGKIKNIKGKNFTFENNIFNFYTSEMSFKDIAYFKVNETMPNNYVYILENPEDLPERTLLSICSKMSYPEWGIDILYTGFPNKLLEPQYSVYGENNITFMLSPSKHDTYKKYILPVHYTPKGQQKKLRHGDSGGTIGIIFDDVNYAIVGSVGSGNHRNSFNIINASQIIPDLQAANIIFNIAYYDTVQNKVVKGRKPTEIKRQSSSLSVTEEELARISPPKTPSPLAVLKIKK